MVKPEVPQDEPPTTGCTCGPAAPIGAVPVVNNEIPITDPSHPSRWKNRRRISYLALVSMFVVIGVVLTPFVSIERVVAAEDLLSWYLISMAGLVGSYLGWATAVSMTKYGAGTKQ